MDASLRKVRSQTSIYQTRDSAEFAVLTSMHSRILHEAIPTTSDTDFFISLASFTIADIVSLVTTLGTKCHTHLVPSISLVNLVAVHVCENHGDVFDVVSFHERDFTLFACLHLANAPGQNMLHVVAAAVEAVAAIRLFRRPHQPKFQRVQLQRSEERVERDVMNIS